MLAVSAALRPRIAVISASVAPTCCNVATVNCFLETTCPFSVAIKPNALAISFALSAEIPFLVANAINSSAFNALVAVVRPAFAIAASTSFNFAWSVTKICLICSSVAPLLVKANTDCSTLKPFNAALYASTFPKFTPTVPSFIASNDFNAIPNEFNSPIICGNCFNIVLLNLPIVEVGYTIL